jgi:hypothetical protein
VEARGSLIGGESKALPQWLFGLVEFTMTAPRKQPRARSNSPLTSEMKP